jgi:hypothetical protein
MILVADFFYALTLSTKTSAHETLLIFYHHYFLFTIYHRTANTKATIVWKELDGNHRENVRR